MSERSAASYEAELTRLRRRTYDDHTVSPLLSLAVGVILGLAVVGLVDLVTVVFWAFRN